MQRNTYVKKHDGYFSKQNEPLTGVQIIDRNYYEFPDMKQAYNKFKEFIGHDNFILTSGTETAVRIALQAFKPALFSVEYPSWTMPSVIAEALEINHDTFSFDFINNKIICQEKPKGDLIYCSLSS